MFLPHQRRDAPIASTSVINKGVPDIRKAKTIGQLDQWFFYPTI